ncbi:Modification methylase DpnIIB [subsurface metagenome]
MKPYYQDEWVTIYHGDCREILPQLPDDSVDLVLTSPPYNVGKEYEIDIPRDDYTQLLTETAYHLRLKLKDDGRVCWNVANTMGLGDKVFSPLHLSLNALTGVTLRLRDIIVWNQLNSGNDTAWGSYCSASAPWLRHQCESVIIAYKDKWKKENKGISTITSAQFMKFTVDLWSMPCALNSKHPTPFPEELAVRCLLLYSYQGDFILDPFLGSGTTAFCAKKLLRHCIGIEIEEKYCEIAAKRCSQGVMELKCLI